MLHSSRADAGEVPYVLTVLQKPVGLPHGCSNGPRTPHLYARSPAPVCALAHCISTLWHMRSFIARCCSPSLPALRSVHSRTPGPLLSWWLLHSRCFTMSGPVWYVSLQWYVCRTTNAKPRPLNLFLTRSPGPPRSWMDLHAPPSIVLCGAPISYERAGTITLVIGTPTWHLTFLFQTDIAAQKQRLSGLQAWQVFNTCQHPRPGRRNDLQLQPVKCAHWPLQQATGTFVL